MQRQIKDGNRIKNALNSDIKNRDQIIANINLEKQENERVFNDTIQKYKSDVTKFRETTSKLITFYDERMSNLRRQREDFYNKYLECLLSKGNPTKENDDLKRN